MTLRLAVLRRTLVGEVAIPPEDEALGPGVAATVDIGPRANTPASASAAPAALVLALQRTPAMNHLSLLSPPVSLTLVRWYTQIAGDTIVF